MQNHQLLGGGETSSRVAGAAGQGGWGSAGETPEGATRETRLP